MFHVKQVVAAAHFAGLDLDPARMDLLERYAGWLRDEAIPAGGLGPREADRIEDRHIADSLLFASQIPDWGRTVWDLGSGIGLPGIPLAIANPDIDFRLVDRSGRRIDLLRRAIRVLSLGNCVAEMTEIERLEPGIETIVARASLPPAEMKDVAERLLAPGGRAILGGSWRSLPRHDGWETVEIPPEVLDHTIWLLIMRRE